DEKV
ncbi:hypothetical protein VCNEP21106_003491B, partial [Vibrio cholerae O1 str. Nep-21106]